MTCVLRFILQMEQLQSQATRSAGALNSNLQCIPQFNRAPQARSGAAGQRSSCLTSLRHSGTLHDVVHQPSGRGPAKRDSSFTAGQITKEAGNTGLQRSNRLSMRNANKATTNAGCPGPGS